MAARQGWMKIEDFLLRVFAEEKEVGATLRVFFETINDFLLHVLLYGPPRYPFPRRSTPAVRIETLHVVPSVCVFGF
jgi:hypothetical protein